MTAPTLTPSTVCAPWCHQGDGHPGELPGGAVCISDLPGDTLTTPDGEVQLYLTRDADGNVSVRVDLTPIRGRCSTLTGSVAGSVAEARVWFAAGVAACDLGTDAASRALARPGGAA